SLRRRPGHGQEAVCERRPLRPGIAVHRRSPLAGGAVRDVAPGARRQLHRGRDRLVEGQSMGPAQGGALGPDRRPRRRAGAPDPRCPEPGPRLLPRPPDLISRPRWWYRRVGLQRSLVKLEGGLGRARPRTEEYVLWS